MAKIDDLPSSIGNAGMEFDYAVWTAGTVITLANVPWNSDYRDIVRFNNQGALNTYISENAGPVVTILGLTYAVPGRPVKITIPFHAAVRFNYIRVSNPAQPIPGGDTARTFYYFINNVHYKTPQTTELEIQLDVWQTFGFDVNFGNCYIERSHFGIANEFADADQGRGYLTVPEGLDIGGEYQIAKTYAKTIGGTEHKTPSNTFDIMVLTTVSLLVDPGTVTDPNLSTAKGSRFQGLPNGAELYWFEDMDSFTDFVDAIADTPWVSQGVISITAVPNLLEWALSYTEIDFKGLTLRRLNGQGYPSQQIIFQDDGFPGDWKAAILDLIPEKYRHLRKFMTYPYSVVELTTYSGTPLVLKPESMRDGHMSFRMMLHLTAPSPRVAIYPENYNAITGTEVHIEAAAGETVGTDPDIINNLGADGAEFLDMVMGVMNLPTFSLVTNAYIAYMAANANSIPYQRSSADWSQQKALTGAQTSFDQAGRQIGLSASQTALQNQTNQSQTELANQTTTQRALVTGAGQAIGGIGGGAAGAAGAVVGMATTAANTAISVNAASAGSALAQGANSRAQSLSAGTADYMRDSNLDLASYSARGDYENQIAGINAKVQDAQLLQPSTVGQMGGDAFNLAMYRWALHAKVKIVHSGIIRQVGDMWLRYGYAVNRFGQMPSDLKCMTKFTYWKLKETYLTSSVCPELYRQTIRGIFEKGVTVWSSPGDIGTIDIGDNEPLEGISL